MKKAHYVLSVLVFSLTLFCFQYKNVMVQAFGTKEKEMRQWVAGIESSLTENIRGKGIFSEIYGMAHNILALDVIGAFEYVRDDAGIMQHCEPDGNYEAFINDMKTLSDVLKSDGIPLLFVQLPDRDKFFNFRDSVHYFGEASHVLGEALEENGMNVLRIEDFVSLDNPAAQRNYFFHSDGHLTTEAEYQNARLITKALAENASLSFPFTNRIYDTENWELVEHELFGGFARSSGKSFSGVDTFATFFPAFETRMRLTIPETDAVREGDFIEVMTNNFENSNQSNPYWILNYGQWSQPVYTYENLLVKNGPRLLVLCDSIALRTNTFLALNASTVTVLDPRYFNDRPFLAEYLTMYHYDAVVVLGSGQEFFTSSFRSKFDLEGLKLKAGKQLDGWSGMWIDFCNGFMLDEQGTIPSAAFSENNTITLDGWAADFSESQPLSALYVQIGDMILQCQYGIPRESVSAYFKNDNLLNTGFSVTIPMDAFLAQDASKVQFIEISADGDSLFEPAIYYIQ